MSSPSRLYPQIVTLNDCDREPIHIIGKTQRFGVLFSFDLTTGEITHHSENLAAVMGEGERNWLGQHAAELLTQEHYELICKELKDKKSLVHNVALVKGTDTQIRILPPTLVSSGTHIISGHINNDGKAVLELEPYTAALADPLEYQFVLSNIVGELARCTLESEMAHTAARLIKDFTGYDRVMIYKFDADWNGQVIAEEHREGLESYMGIHYPATDIPQQARKLFLEMGVRIIEDVSATDARLLSNIKEPLDIGRAHTRSSSPLHIEYLQNMGVNATLNAAIVNQGQLWGLVACHHYAPRFIPHVTRSSVAFLTQVFANQLVLQLTNTTLSRINDASRLRSNLIESMSQDWDVAGSLEREAASLLKMTNATGVVLSIGEHFMSHGETPERERIDSIVADLKQVSTLAAYHTNNLESKLDNVQDLSSSASGILVVWIGQTQEDYIAWVRPEIVAEITWGGNPNKPVVLEEGKRLTPRKSFARYSQKQSGRSRPWRDFEVSSAIALRDNINQIIVEKYKQVEELNKNLKQAYSELETFSYSISHDLRAPLRGIDGFAHIIKEDYFSALDEGGQHAINTILQSSERMKGLIDDIMEYSSTSNQPLRTGDVNLQVLIPEVISLMALHKTYPDTHLTISDNLPQIQGDRSMLTQLFSNLIENAFKYSSKVDAPRVVINYNDAANEISIKDNGIGIVAKHPDRIFKMFSRMVKSDFPGTGIGLAIVQRIVERHDGKVELRNATPGHTEFVVSLPVKQRTSFL